MNRRRILRLNNLKIDPIRGWFSQHDAVVFQWILNNQVNVNSGSGVLEIGVFEGKSTAFISKFVRPNERFIVCDIFDLQSDSSNNKENSRSYAGLALETFQENMDTYATHKPEIIVADSSDLNQISLGGSFRFIHLDGSHLYDHIKKDLELAIAILEKESGVIAVDDFRAQHTPGVAAAVWAKILSNEIRPIILTETKMYCTTNSFVFNYDEFEEFLFQFNIKFEKENFLGIDAIRIFGLSEEDIFESFSQSRSKQLKRIIKMFLPPIILKMLKNFKRT